MTDWRQAAETSSGYQDRARAHKACGYKTTESHRFTLAEDSSALHIDCCQLAHHPRSKLRGSPSMKVGGHADLSGCTPHFERQAGLPQVLVHLEELGQQAIDLGAQGVRG